MVCAEPAEYGLCAWEVGVFSVGEQISELGCAAAGGLGDQQAIEITHNKSVPSELDMRFVALRVAIDEVL